MEQRLEMCNRIKSEGVGEKKTSSEYLANKFSAICHIATDSRKSPYIELQDLQEKPFGCHSFSFPQNAPGNTKEAGVQTISHLLIVSYSDPTDFISSKDNVPQVRDSTGKPLVKFTETSVIPPPTLFFVSVGFLTLVVFDGEIGIVEHFGNQTIIEVVALNRVVFVYRTEGLDHLY